MFERRSVWALILALYVCVLIWQIKVQEPALLEAETSNGGYYRTAQQPSWQQQQLQQQQIEHNVNGAPHPLMQQNHSALLWNFVSINVLQQGKQRQLYAGKHLLAERWQSNESSSIEPDRDVVERRKYLYKIVTSLRQSPHRGDGLGHSATLALNSHIGKSIENSVTPSLPAPSRLGLVTKGNLENRHGKDNGQSMRFDDLRQLIDLHDFKYLMTQPACLARIEALILVHSAPHNYEKRMLIRETWGGFSTLQESPLRLIFLLGAVTEPALQFELSMENAHHGDMVQGSFVDEYRNMTYKHVMAFKWFLYNCAHAQILIKVDDDIYLNTPQLLNYYRNTMRSNVTASATATTISTNCTISAIGATGTGTTTTTTNMNTITTATATATTTTAVITNDTADTIATSSSTAINDAETTNNYSDISEMNYRKLKFNASDALFQQPKDLLFCQEHLGARVKRSYRSKWRVSAKEYAGRYYPPYCPGYAIIYSSDVVQRLYNAAQKQKYFWIDDVYITGVLAQQTNISITTSMRYILFNDMCENLLAGKTDLSKVEFLFAWHLISPKQIRALWQLHLKAAYASGTSTTTTSSSAVIDRRALASVASQSSPSLSSVTSRLGSSVPSSASVTISGLHILTLSFCVTVALSVVLALAPATASASIVATSAVEHAECIYTKLKLHTLTSVSVSTSTFTSTSISTHPGGTLRPYDDRLR